MPAATFKNIFTAKDAADIEKNEQHCSNRNLDMLAFIGRSRFFQKISKPCLLQTWTETKGGVLFSSSKVMTKYLAINCHTSYLVLRL